MLKHAEVFIIGAGPAGVRAACVLADAGIKVVMAGEKLGGAYAWDGGAAYNALLQFSSTYDKFRSMNTLSMPEMQNSCKSDMKKIQKYVESAESKVHKYFNDALNNDNIQFIQGKAAFLSPTSVVVNGKCGDEQRYTFDNCIIASGSFHKKLNIATGKKILDTSWFSSVSSIPSCVSIIGGGFIGLETATFFARLGTKVNIIEKNERILSRADSVLVKKIEDVLKKKEVTIYLGINPSKIERIGQKTIIFLEDKSVESEEVFLFTGRASNTEGLNLEVAGVETDNGKPMVNTYLRTSNDKVYAVGDVTDIIKQRSWAIYSASVAARNILGRKTEYNIAASPSILVTDPNYATVGLTESEGKKAGINVGVLKSSCGDAFNNSNIYVKAVYDKDRKVFVGVEAVGVGAGEFINIFSLIIQTGIFPSKDTVNLYGSAFLGNFFNEAAEKVK